MKKTLESLKMKTALSIFACILSIQNQSVTANQEQIPSDSFFKVETLTTGIRDGMELAVQPNGDVVIVERLGAVKLFKAQNGTTENYDKVNVVQGTVWNKEQGTKSYARESGLLGVALDPNFAKTNWIYLFYSPPNKDEHRVTRFDFTNAGLKNEKVLLSIPNHRENNTCHEGGSLAFGPDGNLFISVGDNTCPFQSDGKAPIDERKKREAFDAQRTSANTNDLRGSILRITPTKDGSYKIPKGNLFAKGTKKTRPEIYAMGCRNPWRISVDPVKGWLHWGEVGPDAPMNDDRGPRGYDELNQAQQAGNFGWPYVVSNNIPYADYDFDKGEIGDVFDPQKLKNDSPNNKGIKKLPPAVPALWTQNRACACAGPVLRSETYKNKSPLSMPSSMDGCLIFYDWNKGTLTLMKLDDSGAIEWEKPFLSNHRFIHPSDIEIGLDGALYVLEYGSKWYGGSDGKLSRITFSSKEVEQPSEQAPDARLAGLDMNHPGTILLKDSLCISCHQTQVKSIGPSYKEVAIRYRDEDKVIELLSERISKGSTGNWGEIPMPPNPQYNEEQLSQMVEAILELAEEHK